MDIGNSSQSFSAGKGSRQRLAATGKGKACERLKKVRKSLTILGKDPVEEFKEASHNQAKNATFTKA